MIIDHVCLATRNIYVTASRLRQRLGLETYDGGWFPHMGVGMRVVPIPQSIQYIEIESVIDTETAMLTDWARWFHSVSREEALVGWTIRCDDMEALGRVGDRLGFPVKRADRVRELPDGSWVSVHSVAPTPLVWPKGLPNFVTWGDGIHPGQRETVVRPNDEPARIVWVEYADPRGELREWLGPDLGALPIRFVDRDDQGITAVGISYASGRELELRPSEPGDGSRPWFEPLAL